MTELEYLNDISLTLGDVSQINLDTNVHLESILFQLENIHTCLYCFLFLFVCYIIHHIFDAVWKK